MLVILCAVGNEKVPLKSHIKNKQDRVREIKKAVWRYALRATTSNTNINIQSFQEILPTTLTTAGPEDLLYESDYNDDLCYFLLG